MEVKVPSNFNDVNTSVFYYFPRASHKVIQAVHCRVCIKYVCNQDVFDLRKFKKTDHPEAKHPVGKMTLHFIQHLLAVISISQLVMVSRQQLLML